MYNLLTIFTRRRIIIALVSTIVLFTAWFIVFHGFIQLRNHDRQTLTQAYKFGSSLDYTIKESSNLPFLLASGNYTIQAPMKSGGIYLKDAPVPNFLGISTIEVPDYEAKVNPIGRRVASNIATSSRGLVSWEQNGEVYAIKPTDSSSNIDTQEPLDFDTFTNFSESPYLVTLSDSTVAGLQKSGNGRMPSIYSFASDKTVNFPSIEAGVSELSIQLEPGGFSVYNKKNNNVAFYKPGSPNVVTKKVNQGDNIATNEGKPAYSFNAPKERLVVATGPNFDTVDTHDHGDEEEEEEHPLRSSEKNVTLMTFNTASDMRLAKIDLADAQVGGILSSPNGKYVAVSTESALSVYETDNLARVIALPYSGTDNMLWSDDNKLVAATAAGGVLKISPETKSAVSLIPYSVIRPTKLSFIKGSSLYLTGYSTMNDDNSNPDAWVIDINSNTDKRQREQLRSFPHQGEGFYVDILNGVKTAMLSRYINADGVTVDTAAKESAIQYFRDKTGSSSGVRFIYSDIDLVTPIGADGDD